MSPSRGAHLWPSGAVQNALRPFHFFLICWAFLPKFIGAGTGSGAVEQCFEQQYANRVASFGSLHIVRRVGVISPLGAFYLAHFIEPEDAADEQQQHPSSVAHSQQHLARHANGDLVLIYSGHSAHSLEWVQLDLLASALRLQPIFGDDLPPAPVSPVLLVTACPAPGPASPLSLPAPFTLKFGTPTEQPQPPQRLSNISPAYENELRINFRTFQNGLLLYSVADHGDHLVVQLSGGHAEVFFDFGGHQRSQLTGGLALNDGSWHELQWSHRFDTAELFVDGVSVNSTEIGGLYRKLDLHSEVEVGGRPEEIGDEQIIEFALENAFHGCLARMELNGIDLLATAPKPLPTCQMTRPQLVALAPGTSLQIAYSFLPFAFDFHVLPPPSGTVPLLSILDLANSTMLQLRVEDGGGALSVHASLGGAGQAPRTIALGPNSRGWHSVAVKLRGGDALELELDGQNAYWIEGHLARRIGSTLHSFLLSAVGCYRSATIDLDQGTLLGGNPLILDHCPLVERCSPNPCLNDGRCLQTGFASFACECERNYTGRFCHISKLPHSCEEHFASIGTTSKKAPPTERILVDLDGGGPLRPFTVECRRSGAKRRKHHHKQQPEEQITGVEEMITVLRHDAPRTGIIVKGVSEPGATRRVLDYGLGESELDRLVGAFEQCGQLMRFQCSGGQRLMSYGNENRPSAWYATRNGQHGLQWGDAPPFSRMCPCAMNQSCTDQQRHCNCDTGRDAVDSGINNHLQLLPVLQLFIGGGPEPASMANVTIGPLECSGRYVFETVTIMDRNLRLITSHTFASSATFHASLSIRLAHPQLTIFTYSSANHERWFQLFVRAGHLVGQLVYAGISHELVSDVIVDDNRWHSVNWEVDELSMRLAVDRAEKTVFATSVPPRASLLIIGSRTGKDRSGFAGQMRNFYLNGDEINLGQMAQRALGAGIQLGEWGACATQNACRNEGKCVELYDSFKCNCSLTPFAGDTCDDEVGMWVPRGSELKIAWQHPAHMSNCFRISIHSDSTDVALIRARALFAESTFNISIDPQGYLDVHIYDGFFFTQNVTVQKIMVADNKTKDIRFCANSTGFEMTINGERSLEMEGNFTFFSSLNSWHFVDPSFSGCVSRLMVGDAFPLKNPRESRLQHTGNIRFGSCPFDTLEHYDKGQNIIDPLTGSRTGQSPAAESSSDIRATSTSSFMRSQRQLLFITPAIGFASALCILLSLCALLLCIQRRPDGVYKTHEKTVPGGGVANGGGNGMLLMNPPPDQLLLSSNQQQRMMGMGRMEPPGHEKTAAERMSLQREYFC